MPRPHLTVPRVSWRDLAMTVLPFAALALLAFWFTQRFVRPAPPETIALASGRAGSIFQATAERYRTILARNGVRLEIVPTEGSIDTLRRLAAPGSKVDVGFVQGGVASQGQPEKVVSLGSIFYSPVAIFYRAPKPIARLSELAGRSLAIGREGSGTRALAETLLRANGITADGHTTLVDLEGDDAANALVRGSVDGAILTGDSASGANMRRLVQTEDIRMFDVTQADAYVRRFPFLSKLELPPGALDLGRNQPEKALTLVATTVELIARPDLHPALSDLLIEAAREVHGRPSLLQKAGEFPAPLEREYRMSDDAQRYYQSGKSFWYRHLPFWLASLVDRTLILLIPLALLLPALKLVPTLYVWRVRQRIYSRYGELMAIEREAFGEATPERRAELVKRLDAFEARVVNLRMPGWWAGELYALKAHIGFVRRRLETAPPG